jgi:hypothetical protein
MNYNTNINTVLVQYAIYDLNSMISLQEPGTKFSAKRVNQPLHIKMVY